MQVIKLDGVVTVLLNLSLSYEVRFVANKYERRRGACSSTPQTLLESVQRGVTIGPSDAVKQ